MQKMFLKHLLGFNGLLRGGESVYRHLSSNVGALQVADKHIGISKENFRKAMNLKPEQPEHAKALKVAIIGAPNAGKSTLLNQLMGWKIAPVSNKVHTTRRKTLGILTEGDTQIIFLDTPGIIHPGKRKRHNLESTLVKDPHSSLLEADLIAVVVDVSNVWGRHSLDKEVRKALYLHQDKQSVLILNKIDLLKAKFELFRITKSLTEGVVNGKKSGLEPSKKKKAINIQKMFEKMVPGHEMKFKTEPEFEVSEPDSFGDATPKPDSPFKMSSLKVNALMQVNTKSNKDQKLKSNENSDTFGLGVKNLTEAQNNTSDTISNICDRNSDKENDHCHSDSGDIKVNNTTDLEDAEVWHEYHSRLRKAERAMEERRGWDGFNSVYMISAIDGDGVWDLKEKLFEMAKPSDWEFHSSVITNQPPAELVKQCILEKVMDNSIAEIPYNVRVQVSVFDTQDDILRIAADVICQKKNHVNHLLGAHGSKMKKISQEAKQALLNTFKQDLTLSLSVRCEKDEEI